MLDPLLFRSEVANLMIKIENMNEEMETEIPRRRGRPSISPRTFKSKQIATNDSSSDDDDDDDEEEEMPKKKQRQTVPNNNVRKDAVKHLPVFVQTKNAGRCKMANCEKKSFIICKKCNVYLCLKRGKNCFYDFHN